MIYVDSLTRGNPLLYAKKNPMAQQAARHGRLWCHLWHGDSNVKELTEFALRIGLRAEYLQGFGGPFPHFDLVPSKREVAIRCGAKQTTLLEWYRERRKLGRWPVMRVEPGLWIVPSGPARCAVCGISCEHEERSNLPLPMPLIRWRKDGKVLVLCWACVQPRIKETE